MFDTISAMAVNRIAEDIADRKGLGDEWANLGEDVRAEVVDEWKRLIIETAKEVLEQAIPSGVRAKDMVTVLLTPSQVEMVLLSIRAKNQVAVAEVSNLAYRSDTSNELVAVHQRIVAVTEETHRVVEAAKVAAATSLLSGSLTMGLDGGLTSAVS
jgi:hypothetical protein